MNSYQQIHGFTAAGDARFFAFVQAHAAEPLLGAPDTLRTSCLGVLEDNLNGTADHLSWELAAADAIDGQPHTFVAELDELIVESVDTDAAGDEFAGYPVEPAQAAPQHGR